VTASDARGAALRAGTAALALAALVAAVRAARRRRRAWIAAGRYEYRALTETLDLPIARDHLYWLFRDASRMARLLDLDARVVPVDPVRSRWTLAGPGGEPVTCTVQVIGDVPELMVAWSVPDGPMPHRGTIDLERIPAGTRAHTRIRYAWSPVRAQAAGVAEDAPRRTLERAADTLRHEAEFATGRPAGAPGTVSPHPGG
jgi:uncharacterized membrane protein